MRVFSSSLCLTSVICAAVASPLLGRVSDALVLAPLYTPSAPPARLPVPAGEPAPYNHGLRPEGDEAHIIADSYIVVFKQGLTSRVHQLHHALVDKLHAADIALRQQRIEAFVTDAPRTADLGGRVHHFAIGSELHGYAGKFSADLVDAIRAQPEVAFVERDSLVHISDIERGAPWGLARISHRKGLSFGTFNRYEYDHHGGLGVDVYVIDTGVNINHVELGGRAVWGKTIPNDVDVDSNGHGSHVAGTIASAQYGVAKNATIIAVKVLGSNGSGSMADVIAGVDWAASQAKAKAESELQKGNSTHKGSVANMSLGGGKSPALDLAVNSAVKDGLHFAVAAGNDNQPACNYSPAGASEAITVGASTIADERAYFSNHGPCVDILAPGLSILSIWNTGNVSVNTISGTSMASPHIAGLAAYLLSIYPETFVPTAEDYSLEELVVEKAAAVWQSAPQIVFGKLNEWIGHDLGDLVELAKKKPKQPKKEPKTPKSPYLAPSVLKKAMIRIATSGILTDLPAQTINRLAFNNFTGTTA